MAISDRENRIHFITPSKHWDMTDHSDDPEVPIICEECGTETTVPLSKLETQLDRHNENRHDGEAHASVDPTLKSQLQDLVAEDLGLFE